jgi:hypothetical protein
MAANAGTIVLLGASGRTYTVDMYVPDAVATNLAFNTSGLAASTSPTSFTTQEPCTIVDISIGAAPTAVGAIVQVGDANVNGATIRWANQLASNPNRMKLRIPLPGGVRVSGLQF